MSEGERIDTLTGREPAGSSENGVGLESPAQRFAQWQITLDPKLLDTIKDAIIATDEQFVVTAWNKASGDMYGWKAEEALGRNVSELINSEFTNEQRLNILNILNEVGYFRADVIHHTKSGTPIYNEVTFITLRSKDGRTKGYVIFSRDLKKRRQAEDLLLFQSRLLDAVEQSIIATDPNGIITYWNKFASNLYGVSPDEAVGRNVLEITPAIAAQDEAAEIMSRLKRGESWSGEFLVRRQDGTTFSAYVTDTPLFDENGAIAGIVGVSTDISERKHREKAIRESEDRYRDLVEHSRDLICTHDLDGLILSVNQVAVNAMGYNPEDFVNKKNIRHILAPEVRGQFDDYMERIHRDGFATGFMAVQTSSGERRIWEYHNTLRTEGVSKPIVRGMAHDITESRRAEEALREREEWFQGIFEGSKDAIFLVGASSRFVEVNQAACDLTGYSREELLSMSIPDLHEEEDRKAFHDYFDSIMQGRALTSAAMILRKDRKKIPVEFSNRSLTFRGIPVMHTTARDVSDRRRLEERLQQLERMEAIGRLAGGIAHDFNNLLTAILGYSELLLGRLDKNDDIRRDIEEIEKAGTRAAALTSQLLAFSRKQMVHPRIINLNSVVTDLMNMLQRMMGKNIELVIDLDQSTGSVKADPDQVERIVINLANNARDAMPDGGKLRIETRSVVLDVIESEEQGGMLPGSYALITVTDTGKGMDQEILSHIFEPFFTTREPGKRLGLGLSTVYGIAQQSGGYISVHSEVGKGTTFKIYLPRVDETSDKKIRQLTYAESFAGSETILLVEDEDAVRKLALHILRTSGYTVLEAANAREALSIAEQYKSTIHLLITDMVMPRMGGRELSQHLLALRPDIKVIYMSGYTDNSVIHDLTLESGTRFIHKPFSPAILLQNVRALLSN